MSFLPENYQAPASSGGNYTKFAQGNTTIRILGDSSKGTAIFGWEGWTEEDGKRQPHRSVEKPPAGQFKEKPKHFWAFLVYNHEAESVQICQIVQRGIQDALRELLNDSDWGDLKQYDVTIQRKGEGLETSYTVLPKPKSPLNEGAVAVVTEALPQINLSALYDGEDPFAGMATATGGGDPF